MSIFFLTFFTLYSGLHLFALLRIRNAFGLRVLPVVCLSIFMACMILAPLFVRLFERADQMGAAQVTAYAGYLWMAWIFLFFVSLLAVDSLRLIVLGVRKIGGFPFVEIPHVQRWLVVTAIGLATVSSVYGFVEARTVRVNRVVVESSRLAPSRGEVRIAQISDLHLGLIVGEKRLNNIVSLIEAEDPHIVVSTGDLVDIDARKLDGLSGILNRLAPRQGKYAVMGNHEFYAGIGEAVAFTERAGFRILRGEAVEPLPGVRMVGVDDDVGMAFHGMKSAVDESALLGRVRGDEFIIVLKHRPLVSRDALDRFDLQLSGHTHGGQIFPFSLVTRRVFPYSSGVHRVGKESLISVSRGSGTWGPPVRLFAPPEITVIHIRPNPLVPR